jgi:hypothetical protein
MTLWMPLLDYAQSYTTIVRDVQKLVTPSECIQVSELPIGPQAALQFYGHLKLQPLTANEDCKWLATASDSEFLANGTAQSQMWRIVTTVVHPVENMLSITLLKRLP